MNTTRERLIAHCRAYPALQIQDLFKYLFQSALGCEHAVSSLSAADAADVDGNGTVDSTDARLILQYAVRKISKFPVA